MRIRSATAFLAMGMLIGLVGCEPASNEAGPDATPPETEMDPGSATTSPEMDDAMANSEVPEENATQEPADIVDTAVAAGDFKTLAAALQAAELVDTLKSEGPFTVFAPTDAAFAKLPEGTVETLLLPENKDQLAAVLTYHVVPGRVDSSQVVSLQSATTVQGADVAIDASAGVKINNATVTAADIICSNGIIHVIDTVLLPPAAKPSEPQEDKSAGAAPHDGEPLGVEGVGTFKTLFAAIEAAGLKDTLAEGAPFTIFAPTDEAFAALPEGTVESLLMPENKDKLVAILTYHVVAGEVPSSKVVELDSAKTVNGASVSIEVVDGKVMVGDATVLKTDIPCEVGIIHAIDKVLLP